MPHFNALVETELARIAALERAGDGASLLALTTDAMRRFVETGKPRHALAVLNRFGAFRFTAVYAFEGELLRNRLLVDRENTAAEGGAPVPVSSTYCGYIRTGSCPFELLDSLVDDRVQGHPKKAIVRSYAGVPIRSPDGACIGTLCCFDLFAVVFPPSLVELLEQAAPLFAPHVTASPGLRVAGPGLDHCFDGDDAGDVGLADSRVA